MATLLIVGSFMLALGLLALACGILLTTLHELGHALAALVLQPGRVTVYLGSHGVAAGGGRLRLGRLRLYFRFNPWRLALGGGLCQPQKPLTISGNPWRSLLFVLAGPLLPLLVATLLLVLTFTVFEAALNVVKAVPILFFGSTLVSAISNLTPRSRPLKLVDGQHTHNDGFQTTLVLRHSRLMRQARAADAHFAAGQYQESARLYELLLGQSPASATLYQHLIQAHFHLQQYQPALTVSRQFARALAAEFTDADHFTQALLLSRLNQHEAALASYTALIEQETPYPEAYNNRGYTQNLLGNYAAAVADFDQAIALGASVAYAHNNRGLAYLRLGRKAEGLADIRHGLQLDPANAYGYRNLGLYHLDRGEYAAALAQLEKAQQLDPTTHDLDSYLQQTRQQLEQAQAAGG